MDKGRRQAAYFDVGTAYAAKTKGGGAGRALEGVGGLVDAGVNNGGGPLHRGGLAVHEHVDGRDGGVVSCREKAAWAPGGHMPGVAWEEETGQLGFGAGGDEGEIGGHC